MWGFHIHLDIEGFVRSSTYPDDYIGLFRDATGRSLTPAEARTKLTIDKARGHKVLQMSKECGAALCPHATDGCSGFDYSGGGCPGYQRGNGKAAPHSTATTTEVNDAADE